MTPRGIRPSSIPPTSTTSQGETEWQGLGPHATLNKVRRVTLFHNFIGNALFPMGGGGVLPRTRIHHLQPTNNPKPRHPPQQTYSAAASQPQASRSTIRMPHRSLPTIFGSPSRKPEALLKNPNPFPKTRSPCIPLATPFVNHGSPSVAQAPHPAHLSIFVAKVVKPSAGETSSNKAIPTPLTPPPSLHPSIHPSIQSSLLPSAESLS